MHTIFESTIEVLAVAVLDVAAVITMTFVIARLITIPTDRYPRGLFSKVAWVAWSVTFTVQLGHVLVPLGALLALRRLRRINELRSQSQSPGLPFVTGTRLRPGRQR